MIATNEQGVVLRYFAGIQRFALTWLGPAYRQVSKEVKTGAGKGGKETVSGHKYYADCAGLLCVGMVDAITQIWMDNNLVWSGNLTRTEGSDSTPIDIDGRGSAILYWGTETQPIDPILGAHSHPAYRGQCYIVFNQLYFGQDTTTAPNVEVVLFRRPKNTGLATVADWDSDCNPAHAMIELLTDERTGLGWNAADALDVAGWDAAAAQLRGEIVAFSPLIDRESDAREIMAHFCEYFDGWLAPDPANGGRLVLRLARQFTGDPNSLPLLGEYELLDPPDPVSQSWRDTVNEITVNYTDRDNDFADNSELFIDQANRRIVGEPLTTSLDRPWVTKRDYALQMATYAARLQSVPWMEAKDINIRKEAGAGIEPGDFVRLTYADYLETTIARVISRKVESDRSQAVQLSLRADGYYSNILPYTPDYPPRPDEPEISPLPPLYQRFIELPFPLVPSGADKSQPHLAPLIARASGLDVRMLVYSSEDGETYDEVTHSRKFCIYGTLAAPVGLKRTLDDDGAGMLVTFPGPDGPLDLEVTNEHGREKMRLLVFVDDEIIAYQDAQIVSPTQARLVGLRRGCYDTVTALHNAGAEVAIIPRKNLKAFTDESYDRGDTIRFKVATTTAKATLDLAESAEVDVVLVNRTARPLPPINLKINDDGTSPTYSAGADVVIAWKAASWRRHGFFESWEDVYYDDKLSHKVKMLTAAGVVVRKINVDPGANSATYAAADLAADFGGHPATFRVQVFGRRRGLKSLAWLEQTVTLA